MDAGERRLRGGSFGAGADAYARGRPTYPDEAVDWLCPPEPCRVLDLGAGTGKLTRLLAARNHEVVAVDPSPEMLERLAQVVPEARTCLGSAESIPLPAACVDAVLVAQAWHWFDRERATAEIARVLRPGGTLALVWNARDERQPWVGRLNRLLNGDSEPVRYDGEPDVGRPFAALERFEVAWTYRLDQKSLVDLATSRSAYLTMSDAARVRVTDGVQALFEEVASASHGDPGERMVALPYVTRCFRTRRAA